MDGAGGASGGAASVPAAVRPAHVALVTGTTDGGIGAYVRALASGLAARGVGVLVVGPAATARRFGLAGLAGVRFAPVEIGGRPRPRDVASARRLGRLLTGRRVAASGGPAGSGGSLVSGGQPVPDVVHAHGLRAGALSVIALTGVRNEGKAGGADHGARGAACWARDVGGAGSVRGRVRAVLGLNGAGSADRGADGGRPALVVTVHNAPPSAGGMARLAYLALERIVARGADLVLCVSPDLERRMRAAGARHVARAIVVAPSASPTSFASISSSASLGSPASPATGRPIVLAAGRLTAQKGFDTLLGAAAAWQDLDPAPLLAIAGDGPLAGELRELAGALKVDVAFLGHVDDVPALLATAAAFVLPSRWEGQPLVLQEAMRAGVPIVATRVGGIPDLVGGGTASDEAALLVPPGDPAPLADAVRAVLTDRELAGRLRAAACRRAATLPTDTDAITAALAAYAAARPAPSLPPLPPAPPDARYFTT